MFGLEQKMLDQILQTILAHKQPEKIVLFGSRATGDFKANSDIDLAIFARDWDDADFNMVHFNLEEDIPIPQKFDVINFYQVKKEAFKQAILEEGKVIYESGNN